MPEALARADHDFVLREDMRPAKARRTPARKPLRFAFLGLLFRRPGRTILFGGAAVLLGGIGVNALFLQSDRHPAPFFRAHERAAAEKPVAEANVPVPPSRPAEVVSRPAPRSAATQPPERAQPAPAETRQVREPARDTQRTVAAQQPKSEAKPEARGDAIAALLRDGRPSAPTPPNGIPNPTPEQSKRIIAVQEALKKLGHSVTPDGIAGRSTRVAIEQFERAQKMQPSGQMSPRVLRELATRSGVKIP